MSTSRLPARLHTQAEAKQLDREAISGGVPAATLMQRAGRSAFELLRECWPAATRLAIYCGGGNNGGDAYVVARLALDAGLTVYLHAATPLEKLPETARAMAADVLNNKELRPLGAEEEPPADVIVDGLLGIGVQGKPRAEITALIGSINRSGLPVFALDLPSGLDGDTGFAPGAVVRADVTLTFIVVKRGLVTGQGPALAGRLFYEDLQLPERLLLTARSDVRLVQPQELMQVLTPRRRDAHKGLYGHVLLVGGDLGFGGAILMAAQAALRCGAGRVSVATRKEHVPALLARQPEIMVRDVETPDDLGGLAEQATVWVAGPGLGQGEWGRALLAAMLTHEVPQVLDADALNLLAHGIEWQRSAQRVLTPHPGEAARLLKTTTAAIGEDRFRAALQLQEYYGGVALLKGAGTLVAAEAEPVAVITSGNPGMATGGMGDILSGIIAALLAQGLSPYDAARLGAFVHGLAGDKAAASLGERGLVATDLLPFLPPLLSGKF